jgi:hypothetical protein
MAFYDSGDALYGTGVYGSASYGIVAPTVALTGVSGTALTRTVHINAFEIDITEPLYGPAALVGSVGTLEFANTVTPATTIGTGQIGTVSPNIAFGITGVNGTVQVGTVEDKVTEKVTGVSATGVINAEGLSIRSINRVPVTGAGMSGLVGIPEPRVDETIGIGVQGTSALGSIRVHVSEKIVSVPLTGSIGALEHSNTVTLIGVEGIAQVGDVEDKPTEALSSVSATVFIGTITVNVSDFVSGVSATLSVGTLTATGTSTVFDPDNYSRIRTVRLIEIQSSRRAA